MHLSAGLIEGMDDPSVRSGETHAEKMTRILHSLRTSLEMDCAFISEFVGDLKYFRFVDWGIQPLFMAGDAVPIAEGYCQKVTLGVLPQMIPDTSRVPAALAIPETRSMPIGSHLSVPLRLSDGGVYGTLCCFSHLPDTTLNAREMRMMQAIANLVASEIEANSLHLKAKRSRSEKIETMIAGGQPTMVYQPIFRLSDRVRVGAEALARFSVSPQRGPQEWFAESASCGLLLPLEIAAIRNALKGYEAVWATRPDETLAVNVSASTVLSGELCPILKQARASQVILEITEHDHVEDYDRLDRALEPLRALGARVAVDDAGAGYASLRHVLRLRPDLIKLDISLTKEIEKDPTRKALAASILEFARQTNSSVLAEGIETEDEFEALSRLGIQFGQGYLLGKPGPAVFPQSISS